MAYFGHERRIHRVFITRHVEYHVRRNLCIAVRDRRTGKWIKSHAALQGIIAGGLQFNGAGRTCASRHLPRVGESAFVVTERRELVTSPILSIGRPHKALVRSYPSGEGT